MFYINILPLVSPQHAFDWAPLNKRLWYKMLIAIFVETAAHQNAGRLDRGGSWINLS